MKFGIQIASLFFIIAIITHYSLKKRIKLMSTTVFTIFLLLCFFNICFEFLSLYTLYNYSVLEGINRFTHQLFIGSLVSAIFALFLYIDIKIRAQKRFTFKEIIVRGIPFLISIIMVLFGKLNYEITDSYRYSYGNMVQCVYVTVFIYLLIAVIILIKNKNKNFTNEARTTIFIGIAIWLIVAIIQLIIPESLVSSLGLALMVLFLYISFENPNEFLDKDDKNYLNKYAFNLIYSEYIERKKGINIIIFIKSELKKIEKDVFSKINDEVFKFDNSTYVLFEKTSSLDSNMIEKMINKYNMNAYLYEFVDKKINADSIYNMIDLLKMNPIKEEFVVIDDEILKHQEYLRSVEEIAVDAILNDGFDVYFQPIYSVKEEKFVSAEALVRLKDNLKGHISPEIFIPLIEKRGLIEELDNIVLNKTCRFIKEKKLYDLGIEYIEVNVSGLQAIDTMFPKKMLNILKEFSLDNKYINIEITETASAEAKDIMNKNIKELKKYGVSFSLDDFGTGYSNLAKTAQMNFDLIKIDKSLVWPYFYDKNDSIKVVLDSSIELIHMLNMKVVVEGVETKEMVEYLKKKNVDYFQGYYYSKPLEGNEFIRFLEDNNKLQRI